MIVETACLYRWYDAEDVLLYVGISTNVVRRAGEHEESKSWWGSVKRGAVEHFDSRHEAVLAERRAIRRERPVHNVQHNGPSRYLTVEERKRTQRAFRQQQQEDAARQALGITRQIKRKIAKVAVKAALAGRSDIEAELLALSQRELLHAGHARRVEGLEHNLDKVLAGGVAA